MLRSENVERVMGPVLRGTIALRSPVRVTDVSPRGNTAVVRVGIAAGVRVVAAAREGVAVLRGVTDADGVRDTVGTPLEVVREGAYELRGNVAEGWLLVREGAALLRAPVLPAGRVAMRECPDEEDGDVDVREGVAWRDELVRYVLPLLVRLGVACGVDDRLGEAVRLGAEELRGVEVRLGAALRLGDDERLGAEDRLGEDEREMPPPLDPPPREAELPELPPRVMRCASTSMVGAANISTASATSPLNR